MQSKPVPWKARGGRERIRKMSKVRHTHWHESLDLGQNSFSVTFFHYPRSILMALFWANIKAIICHWFSLCPTLPSVLCRQPGARSLLGDLKKSMYNKKEKRDLKTLSLRRRMRVNCWSWRGHQQGWPATQDWREVRNRWSKYNED